MPTFTNQTDELKELIEDVIDYHARMRNTFLWKPPLRAADRRAYERRHTREDSFEYGEHLYEYESDCSCSCSHIYFSDGFYVDGVKKTVRAWKKVLSEIAPETE